MCGGWCNNLVTRQHTRCNNENKNKFLTEPQNGFPTRKRSCTDPTFCLKLLIVK